MMPGAPGFRTADDARTRITCSGNSLRAHRLRAPRRRKRGVRRTFADPSSKWRCRQSSKPVRQLDVAPIARPVALRRAGDETASRELRGAREQWNRARVDHESQREPRAISRPWPSRPKPVTSVIACTLGSRASSAPSAVEQRRRREHFRVAGSAERILLDRGRVHADADRLGQDRARRPACASELRRTSFALQLPITARP